MMFMITLKSATRRITANKVSLVFFLFTFLHCFTQGILQSFLYSVDLNANALVENIVQVAGIPRNEIPRLIGDSKAFTMQVCTKIPYAQEVDFCQTMFNSSLTNNTLPEFPAGYKRYEVAPSPVIEPVSRHYGQNEKRLIQPEFNNTGQIVGVNIVLTPDDPAVFLSSQCTRLLVYPAQLLKQFIREDFALIALQFWLLGLTFFALYHESNPHLFSVLLARLLATVWSGLSKWRTRDEEGFTNLVINNHASPCQVNLFPSYYRTRAAYEIPNLVMNLVGLSFSAFFAYKLTAIYNTRTFKTVGPPKDIIRIYRCFMAFFVSLQLAVFCLITAMALWINELVNGAIALLSNHTAGYIAIVVISTVLLVPWISMGWFAVRREMNKLMLGFLALGFVYITGWAVMFYSVVYRWTFITWPFFAAITVSALTIMITSCSMGVICWRNFDKGLAHYLYVEDLLGKDNFEPAEFMHDVEKMSFDIPRKQAVYHSEELKPIPF